MSASRLVGAFIPSAKGRIFGLLRRPAGGCHGCVLVVPPFAEEMNKCRRSVTQLSERLCARGMASLTVDFHGTGDSEGEFADADMATWTSDLRAASEWAAAQDCAPSGLLGIRLGTAVAAQACGEGGLGPFSKTVLWQPVLDGERFLLQFLRLRTAAALMEDRKESVAELRSRIEAGEVIEVAGYGLSHALAKGLSGLKMEALPGAFGHTLWCEVTRSTDDGLSPASQRIVERIRNQAKGQAIDAACFPGEPFWSSTEIVVNEPLIEATAAMFLADRPGPWRDRR